MPNRRDRERRTRRRAPFREPRPIILIVCEGENTEPQYLEGLRRACRNPRVDILVHHKHGVPRTLVEIARQSKREAETKARREGDDNLAYDSVWCVFDIDDHPNVPDARQMARDNGIELAISNPCIELWLLLHFRDNPGMQHRDKLKMMLAEEAPGYDKTVNYAVYAEGRPEATIRAKRMDELAESRGEPGGNPTTGVYKLTELIAAKDSGV